LSTRTSGSIAIWDGLIVAAAERSGAAVLLSEDFQERSYEPVRVVNPFGAAGAALLDSLG
jgi:predicted nucleic acid-binding protein